MFFFETRCSQSVGGSEKSRFVGDEMSTQTWRWTELLQVLEMTTNGYYNHVGSQMLGEARHRLVDMFLWQLFPDGLQGGFQFISRFRLWLEFIVLFQHDTQTR